MSKTALLRMNRTGFRGLYKHVLFFGVPEEILNKIPKKYLVEIILNYEEEAIISRRKLFEALIRPLPVERPVQVERIVIPEKGEKEIIHG